MVKLSLNNWRVSQAQFFIEHYFYEGMILMKLDSVLGMHYFPVLSFNGKQEDICSSLWILYHHQDQYYSVCKSKAIAKSLTDLMEVVMFKKQKHCLGWHFLLQAFWKRNKGGKRKLFTLRHHLSWKGLLKTRSLEAFVGVQISLIWFGRLFHSWILTTKSILSPVFSALILGFANCIVPERHTYGIVHSSTQWFSPQMHIQKFFLHGPGGTALWTLVSR